MGVLARDLTGAVSRRSFLVYATLAGGGLAMGLRSVGTAATSEAAALGPFILIPPNGPVELVIASAEMGQGVYMGLSTLIAEELELRLDQVKAVAAPADRLRYGHPVLGDQITGGSVSIRGFWEPLRRAGATARTLLIAAAAEEWNVPAASLRAEAGEVVDPASGRRLGYGALAAKAARLPVPERVALKSSAEFKLIGKTQQRIDTPAKVTGAALFGLDARPIGLKYAAIAICPTFGGALKSVDDSKASKVKGVRQIVRLSDAVAVVADHTGAARKGLAALHITWDRGQNGSLTTEELERRADAAMNLAAVVAHRTGDVAAAEAADTRGVEAVYRMPILCHSAMEPMNCTVHLRPDGCELWVGTQVADRARRAAAEVAGLPEDKVVVHNQFLGGGFGRRLDHDNVTLAVRIAREVQGPVQVAWSREEDIRHDSYRYLNLSKLKVRLGPDGMPTSWSHRVVGPAIMDRFLPIFFKDGVDFDIVAGAESPYDIPNKLVEFVRHEAPAGMLTGNWRGVGPTRNAPAIEGGIDEAAHLAGVEPVAYRRRLLSKNPRLKAVLDLAVERSGWGSPLRPNQGRGVALLQDFGSFAAMVAQVHVDPSGKLKVERIDCAVDCGVVINPEIVRQQVESGVIYGLSAALYGRLTVADGAIVEGNFDDAPVVRINECPVIETHIVASAEAPGGVGELSTPCVAPSLMNAIFAVTGKRLRTLPLSIADLRGA